MVTHKKRDPDSKDPLLLLLWNQHMYKQAFHAVKGDILSGSEW